MTPRRPTPDTAARRTTPESDFLQFKLNQGFDGRAKDIAVADVVEDAAMGREVTLITDVDAQADAVRDFLETEICADGPGACTPEEAQRVDNQVATAVNAGVSTFVSTHSDRCMVVLDGFNDPTRAGERLRALRGDTVSPGFLDDRPDRLDASQTFVARHEATHCADNPHTVGPDTIVEEGHADARALLLALRDAGRSGAPGAVAALLAQAEEEVARRYAGPLETRLGAYTLDAVLGMNPPQVSAASDRTINVLALRAVDAALEALRDGPPRSLR